MERKTSWALWIDDCGTSDDVSSSSRSACFHRDRHFCARVQKTSQRQGLSFRVPVVYQDRNDHVYQIAWSRVPCFYPTHTFLFWYKFYFNLLGTQLAGISVTNSTLFCPMYLKIWNHVSKIYSFFKGNLDRLFRFSKSSKCQMTYIDLWMVIFYMSV